MPPTLPFLLGFAAGLWWNRSDPWLMQGVGDHGLRMVAGTLITGAGAALFWTGLWTFVRQRTGILLQQPATRIVTTGPYRWSRNPQYVAFVAIYLGASILANTVWPLVLLPLVIAVLHWLVIQREEAYMQRTFRDEYQAYCRRVHRWL
jgi:protein-S-isoprenylcysteine O-methyltransferase Ste14